MLTFKEYGSSQQPTVVFCHAIATSGWMWSEQAELLADRFHCVVPDLPGHGASNKLKWTSFKATAQQVADVIRATSSTGRAHVVGLSLGSYVAMQLLNDAPDVVERVIVSGLNVLPLPNQTMMFLMGVLMMPLIKTNMMIRMNARGLNIPEAKHAGYAASLRQLSRRAFWHASSEAGKFCMPPQLHQRQHPVLGVAGANEHKLIINTLHALETTLPHAQCFTVPNGGHGWNGEYPQVFAAMTRAWLTDAPLPTELQPVTPSSLA